MTSIEFLRDVSIPERQFYLKLGIDLLKAELNPDNQTIPSNIQQLCFDYVATGTLPPTPESELNKNAPVFENTESVSNSILTESLNLSVESSCAQKAAAVAVDFFLVLLGLAGIVKSIAFPAAQVIVGGMPIIGIERLVANFENANSRSDFVLATMKVISTVYSYASVSTIIKAASSQLQWYDYAIWAATLAGTIICLVGTDGVALYGLILNSAANIAQLVEDYAAYKNCNPYNNTIIVGGPSAVLPIVDSNSSVGIYVFRTGAGLDPRYGILDPGTLTWSADKSIQNVGISANPSATVYNGKIYVFHQGNFNNGQLWYFIYDVGSNSFPSDSFTSDTQVSNVGISASPSAVVYNGKIYVFHQGSGNNGQLWYFIYDVASNTFTPDVQVNNVGISDSPSGIAFDNKIYVFHQGSRNNHQFWYNVLYPDSNSWLGDTQVSQSSQ
eukprot:CAMPEP_0196767598 /NCGR_PEP_ID=MMETSP1095-20130614/41776_1 /TAXON_ID=96789 ORGANISM="Chromulina nebulosa, Strain UTEXLB2642" /NCGR_SAMPLE_ID=MMETSP1095 /ASSEMBLY_ACC=CAM_ASM_000446 /LENGTH=442 /DNA_ID=CAMNT_0042136073 /DNA_START=45 /DNA_END=1373 /DNA_ORIENTATION=+